MTEFLRGFFHGVFSPWPKKKRPGKEPAKNVPPNSVRNIRPYTLSTPSEKSLDSYKLIASSGRQFFGFDP